MFGCPALDGQCKNATNYLLFTELYTDFVREETVAYRKLGRLCRAFSRHGYHIFLRIAGRLPNYAMGGLRNALCGAACRGLRAEG